MSEEPTEEVVEEPVAEELPPLAEVQTNFSQVRYPPKNCSTC